MTRIRRTTSSASLPRVGPVAAAVALAVLLAVAVLPAPAVAAPAYNPGTTIAVTGAVGIPTTYTRSALAAMPQTTLPVAAFGVEHHTVTGVPVEAIVQAAEPSVAATVKNGLLRVRVTVNSIGGRSVTVALGELDASFGNHPALLVLAVDGHPLPTVAFGLPGDTSLARALVSVQSLSVAVASPPAPVPPVSAGVIVHGPSRTVTLSAASLQRLPARTATVTFAAGTATQTVTETGPPLWEVLLAAGIVPTSTVAVTAVGSDGYLATVTPGEAFFGGRTLLLSLSENSVTLPAPRLVAGGDVKGGRYVSGVVELDVTR